MPLRSPVPFALLLTGCFAFGSAACGAADTMDDAAPEDVAAGEDAALAFTFVRSDQVSFGRAPHNTGDLSKSINQDFLSPKQDAAMVIAWLDAHPGYPNPIYLGNIHTWLYDTSHSYRVNVHTLASTIHAATDHPILLYFEEENASHAPHPVSKANAQSLRTLAKSSTLLLATYANGQQSHSEVVETVKRWKHWYHDELGVPMRSMMIDVDTSQTPVGFYYGSRGDLANFNHVIGWTVKAAYSQGFGGFHTFGNVGGNYGTLRAADSTYDALNNAWDALVEAHPKQKFSGI